MADPTGLWVWGVVGVLGAIASIIKLIEFLDELSDRIDRNREGVSQEQDAVLGGDLSSLEDGKSAYEELNMATAVEEGHEAVNQGIDVVSGAFQGHAFRGFVTLSQDGLRGKIDPFEDLDQLKEFLGAMKDGVEAGKDLWKEIGPKPPDRIGGGSSGLGGMNGR